jgi:hypothetical protein
MMAITVRSSIKVKPCSCFEIIRDIALEFRNEKRFLACRRVIRIEQFPTPIFL